MTLLSMTRVAVALILVPVAVIVVSPACSKWKLGPGCTIRVVNDTGGTMRNLEVTYPGGIFGIPTLAKEQIHMRWVQTKMDKGCHFTLKFDDADGKQYVSKDFNFAQSCPIEVAFNVDPQHNVSSQILKK